jgi:hypothetical protein
MEESFSYDLLMNMATNPFLPDVFVAAVMRFILVLYIDRIPQVNHFLESA